MEEKLVCAFCGAVLDEEEVNYFDDTIMCEHCLNEQTTSCDNCLERIWRENAEGDMNDFTNNLSFCALRFIYLWNTERV